MNWMTSGRHRALRTKRGKKRSEMHFPAHVQHELTRVRRHPLVPTEDSGTRNNDGTAWYIRPVMDSNQSHDIQMLELAREAATEFVPSKVEAATSLARTLAEDTERDEKETSIVKKDKEKPEAERRCVFTPVKASRQRPRPVEQANPRAMKRLASPPPQDLLLFNEGEELSKPVSSGAGTIPFSNPVRQDIQWKTEVHNVSFEDRSSRLRDVSRFCESENVRRSQQRDTTSLPFYAGSSDEEDEGFIGHDGGFGRVAVQVSGAFKEEKDAGDLRYQQEPRPKRMSLFESIEREMESKRQSFVPAPSTPDELDRLHSATHKLDPESQRVAPPTACFASRPLHSANSRRYAVTSEASQAMKGHQGSSFSQKDRCVRGSSPTSIQEPQDTGSPESTSSQESLVLPPPVDWHKQLVARAVDEDLKLRAVLCETAFRPVENGRNEHLEYQGTNSGWTVSSRTREIFSKISAEPASPTDESDLAVDEVTTLQQRLRQNEDVAVYFFTLVQCHKINEECHDIEMKSTSRDQLDADIVFDLLVEAAETETVS